MSYQNIIVETKGRVGIIRLNRPQALNALNRALIAELVRPSTPSRPTTYRLPADYRQREGLRGRRRHQGDGRQDLHRGLSRQFRRRLGSRRAARKPIVAAVAGFALGGGCELAMHCDIIIAADNANFGQPEIKLGVIPGIGGTQRLTRAVGKAKAMDLILTGRMMDAAEAERSGLVARVVPAASLMEEAMKVADTIANMSLPSVLAGKEAINRAFEGALAEGVVFERRVFHSLFATEDQKEGMKAFVEKRKPQWKNKWVCPEGASLPLIPVWERVPSEPEVSEAGKGDLTKGCTPSPGSRLSSAAFAKGRGKEESYFRTQIIRTTAALASAVGAGASCDVIAR